MDFFYFVLLLLEIMKVLHAQPLCRLQKCIQFQKVGNRNFIWIYKTIYVNLLCVLFDSHH